METLAFPFSLRLNPVRHRFCRQNVIAAVAAIAAIAVLLTITANPAAAKSSQSLTTLNFGTPWVGAAGKSPKVVSFLGFGLNQHGADATLRKYGFTLGKQVGFSSASGTAQALINGSINVSSSGSTPAILAQSAGQQTRAVLVGAPTADLWIIARKSKAKNVKQLAGLKLGFPFGSGSEQYARVAVKRAGIAGKVKPVNLGAADGVAALTRGDIDAFVIFPAQGDAILARNHDLAVIDKARNGTPALEATTVVVTAQQSFIAKHPKLQAALWAVEKNADKAIRKNPNAYYEWYANATGSTAAATKAGTILAFGQKPIATQGKRNLKATLRFLLEANVAKHPLDIDRWLWR